MLPCLVRFRSHLRRASRLGNLFAAPPYIPTSLPPYFLFHRYVTKNPSPQLLYTLYLLPITLSPLAATLMELPASVANKGLTVWLSSLDATLTKNTGVRGPGYG